MAAHAPGEGSFRVESQPNSFVRNQYAGSNGKEANPLTNESRRKVYDDAEQLDGEQESYSVARPLNPLRFRNVNQKISSANLLGDYTTEITTFKTKRLRS